MAAARAVDAPGRAGRGLPECLLSLADPSSHSLSLALTDSNEQVPAICVQGVYYSLSLRMMRSIWRHVRLRKGFVNQERAPFGGLKLRIPSLLYSDKIRTQTRFMVGLARSRYIRAGQSSSLALH